MRYNRFFYVCLLVVFLASSCSKNSLETIPVEQSFASPDEMLQHYTTAIAEATDGWEFGLATKNDTYFAGYLDFRNDGTAAFAVDALAPQQVALQSTGYSVRVVDNNPVLSFPSGAFTQFATERTRIDTVFTFQAVRQDSVYLLGNQYGSQLVLTRTTLQRAEGYRQGTVIHTLDQIGKLTQLPRYFKRLVVNGAAYDLHFRPDVKTLYIHYGGTERFKIHETLYAPTATGISLQKPLVDGINIIAYLDALEVDVEAGGLSLVTNGISRVFTNEYSPSAYDVTAAQKFYNNPPRQVNINFSSGTVTERFSASRTGFTQAGVIDVYGLRHIEGFQYFMFIHLFSGQNYGGGIFVINDELSNYGPAVLRQYSDVGGIISFLHLGDFEDPPAQIADIVNQTTAAFTDPSGFYAISSGTGFYDLVSLNVTGGQKWIRFE